MHRRLLGRVLAQASEQRGRSLARGPPQDGVDQAMAAASERPSPAPPHPPTTAWSGAPLKVQQLVEPEP